MSRTIESRTLSRQKQGIDRIPNFFHEENEQTKANADDPSKKSAIC